MNQVNSSAQESAKTLTLAVYILQAAGFFTGGLTFLIGVILNYVKLEDMAGTWLDSHFRWQLRTFWFGLLWCVLGGIVGSILAFTIILMPLAWALWLAVLTWMIYRIVKGIVRLQEGKAMYTQSAAA